MSTYTYILLAQMTFWMGCKQIIINIIIIILNDVKFVEKLFSFYKIIIIFAEASAIARIVHCWHERHSDQIIIAIGTTKGAQLIWQSATEHVIGAIESIGASTGEPRPTQLVFIFFSSISKRNKKRKKIPT